MNRKGFTLLELLTTLIVFGLMIVITVPKIMNFINGGKENYYNSLERDIKAAGMNYVQTYRTLLPRQIGHEVEISVKELMDNNYIDKVKDENGDICEGKVIVTKVKKNGYSYISCLMCGDNYVTTDEICDYDKQSIKTILDNNSTDSR